MNRLLRYLLIILSVIIFQACKSQTIATQDMIVQSLTDSIACHEAFDFTLKYNLPYLVCKDQSEEQRINYEILNELNNSGVLLYRRRKQLYFN